MTEERKRFSVARDLPSGIASDMAPLGLGAMLMNLGMVPLKELYDGKTPLTPETWSQIRQHPLAGLHLLPEDFPAAAKMIVRTHHENMDGSGYPRRA